MEVKAANKPTTRVWLYRIIDQDTNTDKKLNGEDATIGYLSDLSGKNLQQITPNNTRIIGTQIKVEKFLEGSQIVITGISA